VKNGLLGRNQPNVQITQNRKVIECFQVVLKNLLKAKILNIFKGWGKVVKKWKEEGRRYPSTRRP
jgi:hypothetical protein